MTLDRRRFLQTLAGTSAALAFAGPTLALPSPAPQAPGSFDFVFFTDTHIQPELNAAQGCDMCFHKIASTPGDFAVMGGDHVFDALGVDSSRAKLVFDLYSRTNEFVQKKTYNVIGNHDLFGIYAKSGVGPSDPLYGKKRYQDLFGKSTYYSFDHKGYHFFVLDSIQVTPDRHWDARIDDEQLAWLAADLKAVPHGVPILGFSHVPLVTAFANYVPPSPQDTPYNTTSIGNSSGVIELIQSYNVIAVLQGHTHVNEVVTYNKTTYLTSGAVCGNWWRGLRMGVPEGYTVVSLRNGTFSHRYETYGFKAVAS